MDLLRYSLLSLVGVFASSQAFSNTETEVTDDSVYNSMECFQYVRAFKSILQRMPEFVEKHTADLKGIELTCKCMESVGMNQPYMPGMISSSHLQDHRYFKEDLTAQITALRESLLKEDPFFNFMLDAFLTSYKGGMPMPPEMFWDFYSMSKNTSNFQDIREM